MADKPIKQGMRPISEKPRREKPVKDDFFMSQLHVDKELHEEITSQGLEYRWVDAKQMSNQGGFHQYGWSVYKRVSKASYDTMGFKVGNDPEGIVRRGSCVLATRPTEVCERHRESLRAKAYSAQYGVAARQAEEIRQLGRSQGAKLGVEEGYEDDNE